MTGEHSERDAASRSSRSLQRSSPSGLGEDIVRLLSSALEQSTSLVLISDVNGLIAYVNPRFTETTGYSSEEVLGEHVRSLRDQSVEEEGVVWSSVLERGYWSGEVQNRKKNGEPYWVNVHISPIRDADGIATYFVGVGEDVTERRRTEEDLRRSEERYRVLYEDNPSMYFTVDEQGAVMSVNRYGAAELGYEPDELVGRSVLDVFHEADREAVREQLANLLREPDEPAEWEFRKVCKDGTLIWVKEAARAVRGPDGSPIVLIVCEDITGRKGMEAELRESEARYRALLEATPDMMFRTSREGVCLDYIPAEGLEPLFVDPSQIVGVRMRDLPIPTDLVELTMDGVARALATGETQSFEYEATRGTASRDYDIRVVRVGEDEALVIVRDMTDQKRAAETLQRFREEIEETIASRMAGDTPHNLTFRELTVLQLIVKGNSDKEIGTVLGIAQRTVNKHVENILGKMGAASRTEAGVRAVREGLVD